MYSIIILRNLHKRKVKLQHKKMKCYLCLLNPVHFSKILFARLLIWIPEQKSYVALPAFRLGMLLNILIITLFRWNFKLCLMYDVLRHGYIHILTSIFAGVCKMGNPIGWRLQFTSWLAFFQYMFILVLFL